MRMKEKNDSKSSIFLDSKIMNSRNIITESPPLSGFFLRNFLIYLSIDVYFIKDDILMKLSTIHDTPKKKFPIPMTSNQEIGWHTDVE